jgi:MSHA biogenesis protein MshM
MYLQHFGLNKFPFNLTPDTEFFCALPTYQEGLNVLLISLQSGEGFIKITGPVGSGKTMLCRQLLKVLPQPFVTAYIPNPNLSAIELYQALALELGIKYTRNRGQKHLLGQINDYLLSAAGRGDKVVLLIDEAQAMPVETLEALRLLTNLETEKQKLLQIVLFGQPEFDEILQQKSIRQLLQRISFSYTLQPLNRQQIWDYVQQRLLVAGNIHINLLGSQAVNALYFFSRGKPRLINILTHKALLAAYGQGRSSINWRHVQLAALDTDDIRLGLGNLYCMKILPWLFLLGSGVLLFFQTA